MYNYNGGSMNDKRTTLVIILSAILVIIALCYKKDSVIVDNIKFSKEYTEVSDDNVFVYKDINDIIKIMENGTGVVYLGFPECPWCQAYVKYLNEVAKEVGIEKIYYYNILEDRKNNTKEYQKIVSILDEYLQYDDEGNKRIYVPNVSFHVNGSVIGVDFETSLDTHNLENPKDYWTEEEVSDLKEVLTDLMTKVYNKQNICTECNK